MLIASDGSHMTQICKKTNINQTQFKVLMPPMVTKGFVTMDMDVRATYMITANGRALVTQFDQLAKELAP
jgi:predicted transcriptional regulator